MHGRIARIAAIAYRQPSSVPATSAPSDPLSEGVLLSQRACSVPRVQATWPTAVGESTNSKAREEQLETRLVEAAQDYLECKGIPVALVQLPGRRPPTFVVIGMSEHLPDMLHSAYLRLRPEP